MREFPISFFAPWDKRISITKYWLPTLIILMGILFVSTANESYRLVIGFIIFISISLTSFYENKKKANKLDLFSGILMLFMAIVSIGTFFLLPEYFDYFTLIILITVTLMLFFYYFQRTKDSKIERFSVNNTQIFFFL